MKLSEIRMSSKIKKISIIIIVIAAICIIASTLFHTGNDKYIGRIKSTTLDNFVYSVGDIVDHTLKQPEWEVEQVDDAIYVTVSGIDLTGNYSSFKFRYTEKNDLYFIKLVDGSINDEWYGEESARINFQELEGKIIISEDSENNSPDSNSSSSHDVQPSGSSNQLSTSGERTDDDRINDIKNYILPGYIHSINDIVNAYLTDVDWNLTSYDDGTFRAYASGYTKYDDQLTCILFDYQEDLKAFIVNLASIDVRHYYIYDALDADRMLYLIDNNIGSADKMNINVEIFRRCYKSGYSYSMGDIVEHELDDVVWRSEFSDGNVIIYAYGKSPNGSDVTFMFNYGTDDVQCLAISIDGKRINNSEIYNKLNAINNKMIEEYTAGNNSENSDDDYVIAKLTSEAPSLTEAEQSYVDSVRMSTYTDCEHTIGEIIDTILHDVYWDIHTIDDTKIYVYVYGKQDIYDTTTDIGFEFTCNPIKKTMSLSDCFDVSSWGSELTAQYAIKDLDERTTYQQYQSNTNLFS